MAYTFNPFTGKLDYYSLGAAAWGSITGTLSNQADLQAELDALVPYTGATGTLALGVNNITTTGSLGATGAGKLTKVWTTDLESTNDPTINGTALAAIYAAIAQTFYIGTTQVAINRASAALTLAGITLTTPDIGTPSAGVLTNCTGLPYSGLANGTDGNLITWDADGVIAVVATGDAGEVLTSAGAGAPPVFAAAGAADNLGNHIATQDIVSDTADTDSLGSTTKEWLNLYIGDAGKIYLGLGQDLSLHRSAANTLTITASSGVSFTGKVTAVGSFDIGDATVNESDLEKLESITSTHTQLNYLSAATGTTGTTNTNVVFSTSPTLVTPALGTPASGTLTSCTGLPISTGVSGLAANVATFLATPSSANLISAVTDETGSGLLVFATSPTLTTPVLGTPTSGTLTNCTGLPAASVVAGTLPAGVFLLAEGASVGLDSAGSADEKWSGVTCDATAGATLAVGDLCYLDVTATEWLLADADAATTSGDVPLGLCILAANDGQATRLLLIGTMRSAAFPASIALGAPVYVGTTAGDIQAAQPSATDDVIRRVGWAISGEPNTVYFNPSNDYITHTG